MVDQYLCYTQYDLLFFSAIPVKTGVTENQDWLYTLGQVTIFIAPYHFFTLNLLNLILFYTSVDLSICLLISLFSPLPLVSPDVSL